MILKVNALLQTMPDVYQSAMSVEHVHTTCRNRLEQKSVEMLHTPTKARMVALPTKLYKAVMFEKHGCC